MELQNRHQMEMEGLVDSMKQMREDFKGQIQVLTDQGRRHEQYTTGHAVVKQIGEVHRTLRNICRAPDLSQANLADFDQWSEEMIHTIEVARTNESQYNKVNIEFIYGSIELELRSQAEGHVPAKMEHINLITPEAYLQTLEKLYTPTRPPLHQERQVRGKKTTTYGISHGISSNHVPVVQQSQVQRPSLPG